MSDLARRRFDEKVAIVTGSGSGIGAATAGLLASEGCSVLLVDHDQDNVEAVAEAINADGGRARTLVMDIADDGASWEIVRAATTEWGAVHLLVNNAAAFVQKGFDATTAQWREALGTNLIAPAGLIREVVPAMRSAGGGAIVNVASISGVGADADYATYNSSKAGLIMMTQCLAIDLGSFDIRVNSVSPGITITPKLRELAALEAPTFDEWEERYLPMHCLPRFCRPHDTAQAIAFLLSEQASCITGINLIVDSGYTVKR